MTPSEHMIAAALFAVAATGLIGFYAWRGRA